LDCSKIGVLETTSNKCVNYCSFGFKNVENICYKCLEPTCEELDKKFFEI